MLKSLCISLPMPWDFQKNISKYLFFSTITSQSPQIHAAHIANNIAKNSNVIISFSVSQNSSSTTYGSHYIKLFPSLRTECAKIYSELSISPCSSLQGWCCPTYYFLNQEGDFETKWIQTFLALLSWLDQLTMSDKCMNVIIQAT